MAIEKVIWAVILAFMVSSNTAFTETQIVTMYQSGFWDGSAFTSGDVKYEIKDGELVINNHYPTTPIIVDSCVTNEGYSYVVITCATKYGTGTWIADYYSNTLRFDAKGKNYITIPVTEKLWHAEATNKYVYITDEHGNKLYRVTIKTGKVKKLS